MSERWANSVWEDQVGEGGRSGSQFVNAQIRSNISILPCAPVAARAVQIWLPQGRGRI
jgi:hypothetical protein